MRHGIRQLVLGSTRFLELAQDRYAELVCARNRVFEALYIEEKFAYLVENYRELEIEALASTVHHATLPQRSWSEMVADIHLFNRRIINLLTTTRLYLDQVPQHLMAICSGDTEPTLEARFKTALSVRYGGSFAYRLLEALRNYVQHRGLPLSEVRRGCHIADPHDASSPLLSTIRLVLDAEGLAADPRFKRPVADELGCLEGKLDLRPMIREYVALIAEAHEELRTALSPRLAIWAAEVSDAIQAFAQGEKSLESGLTAVQEHDGGEVVKRHHLSREPAKRRNELASRYSLISSLKRQVITSASA